MTSFPWFWAFWHWSIDRVRDGALLRGPVQGIGAHWDEWYGHEASSEERRQIEAAGMSTRRQRQFVAWLVRQWSPNTVWREVRPSVRFILSQLAPVGPFDGWAAFAKYRESYGVHGVSAVVLAEGSVGNADDVRRVEAITLVPDDEPTPHAVVPEGFSTNPAQLEDARSAAGSLLRGRGLVRLLTLWLIGGQRPLPYAIRACLSVAWLIVAGTALFLVVGPDPGERLIPLAAGLCALWVALLMFGIAVASRVCLETARSGQLLHQLLEDTEVHLRMNGGLRLVGGSAGLPFALNILLATQRHKPTTRRNAWLWQRFFSTLRRDAPLWAATGGLDANGRVLPVVLDPKLQACSDHSRIRHILTPRQSRSERELLDESGELRTSTSDGPVDAMRPPSAPLGLAADGARALERHQCRHLAHATLIVAGLSSNWQRAVTALACLTSVAMFVAVPDLRGLLSPDRGPMVIAPFSSSPYEVWASVDTRYPDDFWVVLESSFWSNRRAPVVPSGSDGVPPRAELRLSRAAHQPTYDVDDGTVWVERRRRFLTREFSPGERVGRFSLSFLTERHE